MSDRSRLRILCFGNPLHGDDGYGPAVALALRKQVKCAGAEIVDCGNRGLDALHYFENVAHVIVIDAMAGSRPGRVHLLRPHDVPVESHHGGHGAGVGYLLDAVRQTMPHPPLIDVIAAEIGPVSPFVPGLSIEVAAAVAETVGLVCQRFTPQANSLVAELNTELDVLREANQALEGELIQSTETLELLISEQEKQQDELQRRAGELAQVHGALERAIGTMAEIFVMLGPDGRVLRVNPLLEQELGYSAGSLIGGYFEDCLTEQSFRQLRIMLPVPTPPLLLNAIRAAGGRFSAELYFRHAAAPARDAESGRIPYLVHASLLHSQAGKLEGAVVVATNISPLKAREKALRENESMLHETAEELRHHRDNLARMVEEQTHDLRLAMQQAEAASRCARQLGAVAVRGEVCVTEEYEVFIGGPSQEFDDFRSFCAGRDGQIGNGVVNALPHSAEIFDRCADVGEHLADLIMQRFLLFAVADAVDFQVDPGLVAGALTSAHGATLDGTFSVALYSEDRMHEPVDSQPPVVDHHRNGVDKEWHVVGHNVDDGVRRMPAVAIEVGRV